MKRSMPPLIALMIATACYEDDSVEGGSGGGTASDAGGGAAGAPGGSSSGGSGGAADGGASAGGDGGSATSGTGGAPSAGSGGAATLDGGIAEGGATGPITCSNDNDCGANGVCVQSTCLTPGAPDTCADNGDCDPGEVCIADAQRCVAGTPGGCGDAGAVCAPGELCIAGQCASLATGCTSDADCVGNRTCTRGSCVSGMGGP